jgi:hypothetical protein
MKDPPNQEFVEVVSLRMSKKFLDGMWESCKDTTFGAGRIGERFQTPEAFVTFMLTAERSDPRVVANFTDLRKW